MKALVWQGGHDFRIEDVPQPEAEPGRIVVKVETAAICGSDFHMDDFGVTPPLVLGHEVAGTVFKIGDGPFGFLHAQIARAMEAGKIIVAGHYDKRLALIAGQTQAVTCNTRHQKIQDILKAEAPEQGLDIVIEATDKGGSPRMGIKALRPRGTLILFSVIWKPEALDMGLIQARELNILGSSCSLNAYGPSLDLMCRGKVNSTALIDVQVPLADFQKAIKTLTQSKGDVFKAVFLPQV